MKRIVRGNDFTLVIPVCKIVSGEQVKFPLPACTDVAVNLVNAYRRTALPFTVSASDDSVIEAKVESSAFGLGTYALEVKGKLFGAAWRSNEYERIAFVDNNAAGDADFSGTDEGEDSVEMDTAIVVLPPTEELGQLISGAENAMARSEELNATLTATDEAAREAETARKEAEAARVSAEAGRVQAEAERVKTAAASVARCDAAADKAGRLGVEIDGSEIVVVS